MNSITERCVLLIYHAIMSSNHSEELWLITKNVLLMYQLFSCNYFTTYLNNAGLPWLIELLHLSGKDKVAPGLSLVLLIIQLCLPSARGSERRGRSPMWGRWRQRGLSISCPATIHHHDICKLVSKTCRRQGLCLWSAMSASSVPDRASWNLSYSGTSLFDQVFFFFSFFLHICQKLRWAEDLSPSILCRLHSTWLWLSN